jgi:hypothetical protein
MLTEARLLELIAEARREQEARTPQISLKLPPVEAFRSEAAFTSSKAVWIAFERSNPWADLSLFEGTPNS